MKRIWLLFFVVMQIFVLWGIYESAVVVGYSWRSLNWGPFFSMGNNISLSSPDYSEPYSKRFLGAKTIRLYDFVGNITVEYGDTNEIIFDGYKILSDRKKNMKLFNESYIAEEHYGDEVILKWVQPKEFSGKTGFNGTITIPLDTSNLVVDVPFGALDIYGSSGDLNVKANFGAVNVDNHVGDLIVKADFGSVKLNNITPYNKVFVEASLGEIVYVGSLAKDSRFEADLGSVKLTLPPDSSAYIDAKVDLGSLNSDFPLSNTTTQGLGKISVGVLGMETPINKLYLRADLGSVDIKKAVMW